MGVKGAGVYPPQSNLGGTEGTKKGQAIPQIQCLLVLKIGWHSEPLFYSFLLSQKSHLWSGSFDLVFSPKTPMAKSSCFPLNNWMLLVGCGESFCKSADDSWQDLSCSCKHRAGLAQWHQPAPPLLQENI